MWTKGGSSDKGERPAKSKEVGTQGMPAGRVCAGRHLRPKEGGGTHILSVQALITMVNGGDYYKLLSSGQSYISCLLWCSQDFSCVLTYSHLHQVALLCIQAQPQDLPLERRHKVSIALATGWISVSQNCPLALF